MDPAHQAMIAALRSIRDQADSVLKQIERPPATAFDALDMQSLPLHKTFYETGNIGRRWQMPPMQMHGT